MSVSISVDRTSLSTSALEVAAEAPAPGAAGLWVVSLGRPVRSMRRSYATSPYLHGAVQTEATLDVASLPLTIGARAATTAALYALMAEAEEAFTDQFVYELTVTENGQDQTWRADCEVIAWDDYSHGLTNAVAVTGRLSIPVYPRPI